MPDVRIGSEIKTYPQGTAYAEIAEEYQKNYENDILLVSVNGRLWSCIKHCRRTARWNLSQRQIRLAIWHIREVPSF